MLALRPNCEHCGTELLHDSTDAMICSFECTYCSNCALEVFENVCPSCGGNFVPRPIRPSSLLKKYPPTNKRVFQPKEPEEYEKMVKRFKNISPDKR